MTKAATQKSTPAADVLADDRVVVEVGDVADVIYSAGINGPALLIIGEVVALAQRNQAASSSGKAAKPNLSALWEMLS